MNQILDFAKDKEKLKICISSYDEFDLDLINVPNKYYIEYWKFLKRKKERKIIEEREFRIRLYEYLWYPKISELMIILYLEDLKGNNPTIWELNKFLRRTKGQYPSTYKAVKKLRNLGIIETKDVSGSERKEKKIFVNKKIVNIYGDDEFRKMMLDSWNKEAKEYIEWRFGRLKQQKEQFEKRIELIKRGKRR